MDKELEGLLDQALVESNVQKSSRLRPETPAQLNKRLTRLLDERFDKLFKDPANWTRQRCLAMIHRETETFLGVFDELVHNTVPNCRRLVRVDGTTEAPEKEWVEGPQWLTREAEKLAAISTQRLEEICVDLRISTLGMSALGAVVQVHIDTQVAGITKVCLTAPTRFSEPTRSDFLFLPAGTNVLAELSYDCKLTIKAEVNL